MEIVFDWFDYESFDVDICFESFVVFYKEYLKFFFEKRKEFIIKMVYVIVGVFVGKNKSEFMILGKL